MMADEKKKPKKPTKGKQHLGYMDVKHEGRPKHVPVFVVWLDDAVASLSAQVPYPFACPSCGNFVDLTRIKTEATFQRPEVHSVAVGCRECGAALHFDKTPEDRREGLTWTSRFAER